MSAVTHQVLGRTVTMPVRIRAATAMSALFSVRSSAAQDLIGYSSLTAFEHRRGRSLVVLLGLRYLDGDLGTYDEFGVGVVVQGHASATGRFGILVHRLVVNGEFTRVAGRDIWGFPKVLADFDTSAARGRRRMVVRQDGRPAVDLSVGSGLPVALLGPGMTLPVYTQLGGVTRVVRWWLLPHRVRVRPGGVRLRLGDGEMAAELSRLGLPQRAQLGTTIGNLEMSFDEAHPLWGQGRVA